MFCSHCGKEIDDKAVICINCGVPVSNAYNAAVNGTQNIQPVGKSANPCAIAGFVLSMAGLFFGLILYILILSTGLMFWASLFSAQFFIVGLVLSVIGMVKSKKCNSGQGFAIAGTVISLSVITIYLGYLIMVFFILFIFLA